MITNMPKPIALGPVMLDIPGFSLTEEDRERLMHPLVGGVIFFTRNYQSIEQITQLTKEIHDLRTPRLLIAVDHEGGRVQRFRSGFTPLPAMRGLGKIWDEHPQRAKKLAEQIGFVLAAELRACGIDFSFTPVLDVDFGESKVIGDRAFHRDTRAISELSYALTLGLKHAGMASCGKHFPGHGFVTADSHIAIPVDERSFAEIEATDLVPFRYLINNGLNSIMPAHVIYPQVDDKPAGFSEVWLKKILRGSLAFDGIIFSDDLSMEGASVAGDIVSKADAAMSAGCDMVLVCNDLVAADQLLERFKSNISATSLSRLVRMHGRANPASLVQLHESAEYMKCVHAIAGVGEESAELPLS